MEKQEGDATETIKPTKGSARAPLNLVINRNLVHQFEELFAEFKSFTNSYFSHPSKTQFFETGCDFIKLLYTSKGKFRVAPMEFRRYISRRGKRPIGEDHASRKDNAVQMFLSVSAVTKKNYLDIIYSFLKDRDDVGNGFYSTSYFFKDFLDMLTDNFAELCEFGSERQ